MRAAAMRARDDDDEPTFLDACGTRVAMLALVFVAIVTAIGLSR